MRKRNKIAAIVLALLMLLSLSACSMADMPILKAALSFAKLNSVHIAPEGELALALNLPAYGMNMDVTITAEGDFDYCADPLQLAGELRILAMDEPTSLLVYGEDVNGDFILDYSTDGGETWQNKTFGKTSDITESMDKTANLSISDIISLGKELGSAFSGFTKMGPESVDERSATRYDAVISLRSLVQMEGAQEAFFEGMAQSLDTDAATLAQQIDLSALEDMSCSLWLEDGSGSIIKVGLDMTALMQSLFASGLLDTVLAEQAGLEGMDFSMELKAMDLALTFSQLDSVGTIERPHSSAIIGGADEPTHVVVGGDAALVPGSAWVGTVSIENHAGQGNFQNGVFEVWAILGESGGRTYFEIYDAEDAYDNEASPAMSFWAVVDGDRIVPDIDPDAPEDAWLLSIYLDESAEDELVFTLENGALSASYLYYDADSREAFDLNFTLYPEP